MTRLWSEGEPIQVVQGGDDQPAAFFWHSDWRVVEAITVRWRVRAGWWRTEAWREYFKLTTRDGLLCTVYRDMATDGWRMARLYD